MTDPSGRTPSAEDMVATEASSASIIARHYRSDWGDAASLIEARTIGVKAVFILMDGPQAHGNILVCRADTCVGFRCPYDTRVETSMHAPADNGA